MARSRFRRLLVAQPTTRRRRDQARRRGRASPLPSRCRRGLLPTLVGSDRDEVLIQEVRLHRKGMPTVRGALEPPPLPRHHSVLPHQPGNAPAADPQAAVPQFVHLFKISRSCRRISLSFSFSRRSRFNSAATSSSRPGGGASRSRSRRRAEPAPQRRQPDAEIFSDLPLRPAARLDQTNGLRLEVLAEPALRFSHEMLSFPSEELSTFLGQVQGAEVH